MTDSVRIEAITFDFFNTLVFHREGRGRGTVLMEYLETQGFSPEPWNHSILYDVFAFHGQAYSPVASQEEKDEYYARLAERIFDCLGITYNADLARRHSRAVWQILGPDRFDVFPDVPDVLRDLRDRNLPLAIVSNWQPGLRHFCYELGILESFAHVLASAELGIEKPDARIFREACRRLGVSPERTLHVGDTMIDDYAGGRDAGMQVVLILRSGDAEGVDTRVVRTLAELPDLITPAGREGE